MPDLIADGLKLHYVAAPERPRRPAIVFLHGAGANHTIWLGQMKALRDRAWVVLPDLPGHGRSGAIPGRSIEEYADALLPHLAALRGALPAPEDVEREASKSGESAPGRTHPGGPGASAVPGASGASPVPGRPGASAVPGGPPRPGLVLAGHSMGGAIALTVALRAPGLLSGLVLIGTGAKLRVSQEILQGLIDAPTETRALIARWSFADGADPDLIVRTMKSLVGTSAERTRTDFLACDSFDLRERLGEIALPTLVLCGREDRMTPPKHSEYLRDRIPGAELRIIEGAGHGVMIEASTELSEAVAEMLSRIDRRG